MCRPSRINPKLSAYQQVWGNFDFNKTPLAPSGCKVVLHERAMERGAWACHGIVGYYIGPAMKHYRNYDSYIPETRGERTTNTLEFFPDKVDMPTTSSADRLSRATEDLVEILQHPHPATPLLQQRTVIIDAMEQLIFNCILSWWNYYSHDFLLFVPLINFPFLISPLLIQFSVMDHKKCYHTDKVYLNSEHKAPHHCV